MKKHLQYLLSLAYLFMTASGYADSNNATPNPAREWMQARSVRFLENKGQITDMNGKQVPFVLFKAEAPGMNMYITEKGLTYVFIKTEEESFDRLRLTGGDSDEPVEPSAEDEGDENKKITWTRIDMDLSGATIKKENIVKEGISTDFSQYFLAHCPNGITDVRSYEKITIKDVYPGIDWVFYNSSEKGFKYDFIVHPGANPKQIELIYSTLIPLKLDKAGNISIKNEIGTLTENAPYSYIKETNEELSSEFQITDQKHIISKKGDYYYQTTIAFQLSTFNFQLSRSTLVIDPQLEWATFFGGDGADGPMSLATDAQGNVFVAGYTTSNLLFPIQNALQGTFAGNGDAFITKFNTNGGLLFSTYYGGSLNEKATSIATDINNNVFVAGFTISADFPMPLPTFQGNLNGDRDIFILKLSNAGNLIWSTFYGGNNKDGEMDGTSLCTDVIGNIFVTGFTNSANFPVTANAHSGNGDDSFILKFDNAGNRLWATCFGGNSSDRAHAIASDSAGNVFVTGTTFSSDFPVTAGAFQEDLRGWHDIFIVKFDDAGNLLWSTYCGGNGEDEGGSIATDPSGNVFVSGNTRSTDFPVVPGSPGAYFKMNISGPRDAVILKFDNSGDCIWSTYYGGSDIDLTHDNLAIDACGTTYVSFITRPNSNNIRKQKSCDGGYMDSTSNGDRDQFIVQFSNSGKLLWATFLGGNSGDFRSPLTLDSYGNLFVSGEWGTLNSNIPPLPNTYPNTAPPGAYSSPFRGVDDGFMVKFANTLTLNPIVNADCGCNSTATVNPTGGCAPYSYLWNDGQTTQTATGLCEGNYTVRVASDNCSSMRTATVTITPIPTDDASFSYSSGTFCQTGTDPSPTITGLADGTFTFAPVGLSLDSATGLIDLDESDLNTYTVTYTTNGPCPNSSSFNVTITLIPDATFGYNGPYCKSDPPNPFPVFPAGSSAGVFSFTPTGLVFVNPVTGQINLNESDSGTYTVTNTIDAAGGCPAASFDAMVTITTPPDASFSYNGPFCKSDANPLPIFPIGAIAGTFSASPGLEFIDNTTGEIDLELSSPGTHTVTNSFAAGGGCPAISFSSQVIITAPFDAAFDYNGPFCQNDANPFPVFPPGSSAGIFSSTTGLVFVNVLTGQIRLNQSTPGTYTVTNTIAASGGCPGVSFQVQVTITAPADPSFTYNGPFCQNDNWNPLPSFLPGATAGTFSADPAGLTFIDSSRGEINLSQSTPGTYIVTNTIAAIPPCPAISYEQVITIHPPPVINITPAAAFICTGSSTPLTASGASAYSWTPANGLSSASGATVNASPANTITYTVTGTDANNCVNDTTVTVTVLPLPDVAFVADTTEGCSPLCVDFTNTSPGEVSSLWNFGDGDPSDVSNPVHCYAIPGSYGVSLMVTDTNECSNTTSVPGMITVFPLPAAAFNASPQPTTIVNPQIYFTDFSVGADHWFWNFGDKLNSFSTVKDPSFAYADTGAFKVTLIVNNSEGCTDTTYGIVYIKSGFTFYIPNAFTPDNDGLNDFFGPEGNGYEAVESFEMAIYNQWGEEIYHTTDMNKPWDGKLKSGNEMSENVSKDYMKQDVYVYKIKVKLIDNPAGIYVGNVTLIR